MIEPINRRVDKQATSGPQRNHR